MKLTYDQYRQLAQLVSGNDRIVLKNKKGQVLKAPVDKEWHQREMRFSSTATLQRPSHAPTVNLSLTSLRPLFSQPPRRAGKR
jgi:hypothetical protein